MFTFGLLFVLVDDIMKLRNSAHMYHPVGFVERETH